MAAFGAHDNCPNCGARMAADQRYCLNCGHRRGEPRLPFMDAVSFMDSMNAPGGGGGTPPPPPPPTASGGDGSNRWNANAALIAGVATLVLAIGVGFLIGRSGHGDSTQAATPQVIKVEGGGGGGGEATETETGVEETGSESAAGSSGAKSGAESGGKPKKQKKTSEVKEGSTEEKELIKEKTEETLHAEGPLAETGVQPGESCEKGTPGCSSGGEFNGNFFGE
jgi:hypothetical protein